MSLVIPQSKNYQSPLIATVSRHGRIPPDGKRQVSMEFDWTAMGQTTGTGPSSVTAINVNMSNNATLRFSQILSLKVDNSQCGADVEIIFTDTQDTITIPAYSPNSIFPVFTDSTQFFAVATGAIAGDVTRIQALNFDPGPVSLNSSQEQNFVTNVPTFINLAGNTQLVPAGVNGTLTSLFLGASVPNPPSVAGSQTNIQIVDGGGANFLLNSIGFALPTGGTVPYVTLFDRADLNWRFTNGVKMTLTVSNWGTGNGFLNNFATYRAP